MLAQPRGLGGERKRAAGTIKCFTAEGIEDRKDFTEGGHFYEQIKPPSACHREVHSSGRENFSGTFFLYLVSKWKWLFCGYCHDYKSHTRSIQTLHTDVKNK